jgi:hypothetical protein
LGVGDGGGGDEVRVVRVVTMVRVVRVQMTVVAVLADGGGGGPQPATTQDATLHPMPTSKYHHIATTSTTNPTHHRH